jgi:hypothetical protein
MGFRLEPAWFHGFTGLAKLRRPLWLADVVSRPVHFCRQLRGRYACAVCREPASRTLSWGDNIIGHGECKFASTVAAEGT